LAIYFFDTSALVKRHVREAGSAWVRSLTRTSAAHTIILARITAVEVFAAITRRQRSDSLSPGQAGAMLGHFRRHLKGRYHAVELTPPLTADAMLMARKHGLRAYDAVQLASFREVDRYYRVRNLRPVTLISSDLDLNSAASAEGLAVEDPNTDP
jgi:uncharacterized protein